MTALLDAARKANFDRRRLDLAQNQGINSCILNGATELLFFLSASVFIGSSTKVLVDRQRKRLPGKRMFIASMGSMLIVLHLGGYMGFYYFLRQKPAWQKELEECVRQE